MKLIPKFVYIIIFTSLMSFPVKSENRFGLDVGWAYLPGFEDEVKSLGQTLANELGTTVTVESDTGALLLRGYGQFPIDDNLIFEGGIFISGDVETKYTYSGGSTTITQDVVGFDASLLFEMTDGILLKGGFHNSEVDGNATITLGSASATVVNNDTGTSFLFGAQSDDKTGFNYSLIYYEGLGGGDDSDATVLSFKFSF